MDMTFTCMGNRRDTLRVTGSGSLVTLTLRLGETRHDFTARGVRRADLYATVAGTYPPRRGFPINLRIHKVSDGAAVAVHLGDGLVVLSPADAQRLVDALKPPVAVAQVAEFGSEAYLPRTLGAAKLAIERRAERGPAFDDVGDLDSPEVHSACTKVSDALRDAFTWTRTAEGYSFWLSVYMRLREMGHGEYIVEPKAPAPDLSAYTSATPEGFGTVLGHLAQAGVALTDLGLRDGQRLAREAKKEGVAETWVRAPSALDDVCERVRAYPTAFLVKHLGPVE